MRGVVMTVWLEAKFHGRILLLYLSAILALFDFDFGYVAFLLLLTAAYLLKLSTALQG